MHHHLTQLTKKQYVNSYLRCITRGNNRQHAFFIPDAQHAAQPSKPKPQQSIDA